MGDFLIRAALVITSILGAACSQQLTDEFKAWTPWVTRRFLALAVRILPLDQRERYCEEWQSFICEIPGEIGKVLAAMGCVFASFRVSLQFPRQGRIVVSEKAPCTPEGLRFGSVPESETIGISFIAATILVVAAFAFDFAVAAARR